jgi:hypothetical protein
VFLYVAPAAVVGFVLALFLKQVPLRDAAASGSTDMGERFGMPTTESPEKLLEIAVGRLLQRTHGIDFEALAQSPRSHLDPAGTWALLRIYRHAAVTGEADLEAIAEYHRLPRQVLEPTFDRLVAGGYATRAGDQFALTPRGASEVSYARDVIASWITDTLAKSPEFEGRPERMQVQGALERVARNVLLERDGTGNAPRPMKLGAADRLSSAPTTRFHAPSAPVSDSAPTRPFRSRAVMPRR